MCIRDRLDREGGNVGIGTTEKQKNGWPVYGEKSKKEKVDTPIVVDEETGEEKELPPPKVTKKPVFQQSHGITKKVTKSP